MKRRLSLSIFLVFVILAFFVSGQCVDEDEDGYGAYGDASCSFEGVDCDDTDAGTNPGAVDIIGDLIDNDCNGVIDDGTTEPICGDGICDIGEECGIDCDGLDGSVCGDGVCDDEEDSSSCLDDCHCGDGNCDALLEENETSCPIDCLDFGGCYISSADFVDADGVVLEYAFEGDIVTFSAEVDNLDEGVSFCDGKPLTFIVVEVDFDVDVNGEPYVLEEYEEIARIEANISNGKAEGGWLAEYAIEDPDPLTGEDPDYVLFGALLIGETPVNESEPVNFLVVYPLGATPREDIDTSLGDEDLDITDETTGEDVVYEAGAGGTEAEFGRPVETPAIPGDVCGDGICAITEDEVVCPEDCLVAEGGVAGIVFFIFVILLIGGSIAFFLVRRWLKKKKPLAPPPIQPVQPVQPQQPAQQQPVQLVQPQQPVQQQPAQPQKSEK